MIFTKETMDKYREAIAKFKPPHEIPICTTELCAIHAQYVKRQKLKRGGVPPVDKVE